MTQACYSGGLAIYYRLTDRSGPLVLIEAGDVTMKNVTKHLLWVGILAALALPAFAETRTIFWNPITTYTDGTPFETGKTITYTVYWTTDPGLASLHTIGTSLATTSTTFDPDVQGMTRGGTVYFTGKAVLNTGEESALSPAFAWVVPVVTPPPPPPPTATLTSVTVTGPTSVNEGGTGTYTATGRWDDGTTAPVSPTWTENSTFATITSGGVLTASAVTANQTVTVTATYGGRTGTMNVTIVNAAGVLASVTVTGPTSVNEGGTATYTATGRWDDGTTAAVTPTWTENSTFATITSGGVLTASAVTANQTVTVTATYGGRTGTMNVTIVNSAGVLASVAVSGPTSVNEGGTGSYTATGTWDNGTTAAVSPTWTEDSTLRDDHLRRRPDGVRGDGEPDGDGDGDVRRPDRHDERDDRRRTGDGPGGGEEYRDHGSDFLGDRAGVAPRLGPGHDLCE